MTDEEREVAINAELAEGHTLLGVIRNSQVRVDVEQAVVALNERVQAAVALRVYPPILVEQPQ